MNENYDHYVLKTARMQAVDELPVQSILREENFPGNLNFAASLMANLLNLNSAHSYILRNLSMIAYQNSLTFNSVDLTNLSQGAK